MYLTLPVTNAAGWCLHWVISVEGTPKSSSEGPLMTRSPLLRLDGLCCDGGSGACLDFFGLCRSVAVPDAT